MSILNFHDIKPCHFCCRVEQQKVAGELEKLQAVLESKEAQMARVLSGDGQIASLKGHYDRMLTELQTERDELKKERLDLLQVGAASLNFSRWPMAHCVFVCGRRRSIALSLQWILCSTRRGLLHPPR